MSCPKEKNISFIDKVFGFYGRLICKVHFQLRLHCHSFNLNPLIHFSKDLKPKLNNYTTKFPLRYFATCLYIVDMDGGLTGHHTFYIYKAISQIVYGNAVYSRYRLWILLSQKKKNYKTTNLSWYIISHYFLHRKLSSIKHKLYFKQVHGRPAH